jgi:hypothetical protein
MGSIRLVVLAALVCGLVPGPALARPTSSSCVTPGASLTKALRKGMTDPSGPALVRIRAVLSPGTFPSAPAGMRRNVYFVSARVTGKGVATWAVSSPAFKSGSGFILSVDPLARAVSRFGSALSREVITAWGFNARARGYEQSRKCAS